MQTLIYKKYGCFEKIPTKYQLIVIISTTAYICFNKNAKKGELKSYLNIPVQVKLKNNKYIKTFIQA